MHERGKVKELGAMQTMKLLLFIHTPTRRHGMCDMYQPQRMGTPEAAAATNWLQHVPLCPGLAFHCL